MNDIVIDKNLGYKTHNVPFSLKAENLKPDGTFKGYASTFGGSPDFYGDIIVYGAFADTIRKGGKFGNGISMLVGHNKERPAGYYPSLVENRKGLQVNGQLALETTDGKETFEFMKLGIYNSLSIGYELLKTDSEGLPVERDSAIVWDEKKNIRYLKKLDLWEISASLFPANPKARINQVKEAIQSAKTVRQLECALKENGLSNSAAKYITSLCKSRLCLRDEDENGLSKILKSLRQTNADLLVSSLISRSGD